MEHTPCSSTMVPRTYKKRSGTTANEGFLYEIRICMLLVLRCVAQGLGFELKSNVEDEEKLFDDVVCKITKPGESGPDQVKHLFLQAKHYTGKNASIFKTKGEKKKDDGLFPLTTIDAWFESFKILLKQCSSEDFEMVFYTTIDIEPDLKQFFSPCKSEFQQLLLSDSKTEGNIYGINSKDFIHSKPESQRDETLKSAIEHFCRVLKIIVLQPEQYMLGNETEKELQMTDPEREVVYKGAYSFMENWYNSKETAAIIDWDIYTEAAKKTDPLIFQKIVSNFEQTEKDFLFRTETIEHLRKLHETSKLITGFPVESFEIYIDLFKQMFRESKQKDLNFFVCTLPEFKQMQTLTLNSKTYTNKTFHLVKVSDTDVQKEHFTSSIEQLITDLELRHDMHVIFLVKLSAELKKYLPKNFPLSDVSNFETFSNLAQITRQKILSFPVEFMGEHTTLGKLKIKSDQLIDAKMLASIKEGKNVIIGQAVVMKRYNHATYIPRQLKIFNTIPKEKIFGSSNLTDQYIIIGADEKQVTNGVKCTEKNESVEIESKIQYCSKRNAEKIYHQICINLSSQNHSSQEVHLFKRKNKSLVWLKTGNSQEESNELRQLMNDDSYCSVSENKFIEHIICNSLSSKVVLVSSNPGMGKSQLACSLARNLRCKTFWPVLVNLNQCTELFESFKKTGLNGDKSAMQVLEKNVADRELENFKKSVKETRKVVVLFDGFDEIAPKYSEVVLSIVKSLCQNNIKNIVILTRPHLAEEIRKETSALLVELKEFDKTDIKKYLYKHYTQSVTNQKDREDRLDEFTLKLTDFIFSENRSYWMEVTGVPLQTYMVAEVFRERCEQYVANTDSDRIQRLLPSDTDKEMDLYGTIVKHKVSLFMIEKHGATSSPLLDELVEELLVGVMEKHTRCGLVLIFGERLARELFRVDLGQILKSPHTMRYGVLTCLSEDYIDFIHRSFAEYFCAVRIANILLCSSGSTKVKQFIYNSVLIVDGFELIRKFVDIIFSKVEENLCLESLTNAYKEASEASKRTECKSNPKKDENKATGATDITGLLLVAAAEGHAHITKKILDLRLQDGGHGTVQKLLTKKDFGHERTPLQRAAEHGYTGIVRELLEAGADLGVIDKLGQSPLHQAAEGGHLSTVEELLDRGAHINLRDMWQQTALHWAAEKGYNDVVELLLDREADPEARDDYGRTPLHIASYEGHTLTVRLLARTDCQLRARDKKGKTPLHHAAQNGKVETIRALVEKGAGIGDTDNEGNTPLHHAAAPDTPWSDKRDQPETARVLLELGAELNLKNQAGKTPLALAREKDRPKISTFLEFRDAIV